MHTPTTRRLAFGILIILNLLGCAVHKPESEAETWTRTTLKQLSLRQKIAQMMVHHMRLDYLPASSPRWQEIDELLSTDGIGFLHVWGGEVTSTYALLNEIQTRSPIPVIVQADLEYGLKGRFGAGTALPWPMALTATGDPKLAYEAGRITAEEGRALGIHLALAPIVDVNNNPENPIINIRAFSEDPDQVIEYAEQFMRGLQEHGMLATAKHFPGHGDTQTDSHTSLARIPDDPERLWSLELKPFQALINSGVDLIMVGHLDAGSFQMEPGVPASLSPFWLRDILRKRMGFKGAVITDAMGMGGITNNYSDRYALIQTIKAGSDIIILNYNFKESVDYVEEAVHDGLLSEDRIDESALKILTLKARLGLHKNKLIRLNTLQTALDSRKNQEISRDIMQKALTLVKDSSQAFFPLMKSETEALYIIDIKDRRSDHEPTRISRVLSRRLAAVNTFIVDNSDPVKHYDRILQAIPDSALVIVNVVTQIKMKKNRVMLIDKQTRLIRKLAEKTDRLLVNSLGTPYLIQSFPEVATFLCAYSAQPEMQESTVNALLGRAPITGTLPVSIPGVAKRGFGLERKAQPALYPDLEKERPQAKPMKTKKDNILFHVAPEEVGADPGMIMPHVQRALEEKAWPGGVLLAAKDGKIFLHEYFGSHTYAGQRNTYRGDIFDLASVTKVIATTSAAMKLYEEGKLDLDTTVVSYLPEFTGPDSLNTELKRKITIKQLLTHTAGMKPFKRFYEMEAPSSQALLDSVFQAELDTLPGTHYAYSDIGLITLGKVLERIAGTDLKSFTDSVIFTPLAMSSTGYLPTQRAEQIVPTEFSELEHGFIHGYVHDENSHSLGGITGHAGLFSTALDLARFAQMMLNHGSLGDTVIFKPETIELFTHRANMLEEENSRCLGWDSPHEASSGGVYLSPNSFGHTGFTGTSIWIDPDNQIFVILLTNAVHPDRKYKYPNYFDWRQRIHSAVYESLGFTEVTQGLEWRDRWIAEARKRESWLYKLFHLFK